MKIKLILLIFAVAILAGVGGAWLYSRLLEPEPSTETTAQQQPDQSEPQQTTQFTEPDPAEIEANNPNGPWSLDLKYALSTDGETFGEAETFVERAGVPSVIEDEDGRLIAAFQWFPQDNDAWDRVAVSISEDQGETWSDPEAIVVDGLPSNYQRPFDPTLTLTPDGRIRLFFTSGEGMPGPEGTIEIYSAISEDGITYTFEEEPRLAVEGERVYDSAAIWFQETWHLSVPVHATGAYHTTSTDGLTFEEPEVVASTPWNWTGNYVLWGEDQFRFYGSGPGIIWWSESSDGSTWSTPKPTNTQGGDPAVVQLEDESYLMIFVSFPTKPPQPAQ